MKRSRQRDPAPVSSILQTVLSRLQPPTVARRTTAQALVEQALPSQVRQRVKVTEVTGKVLRLTIDSSALLSEIKGFHSKRILELVRANAELEQIESIAYRLGNEDAG
jgi:hypothetical protein